MYAIDFFCGAGGLTRGLMNAGISVLAGIDFDESCRETYEFNNKPAKFIRADINELKLSDILNITRSIDPKDLLLAACAPCQPFTSLNKYGRDRDALLLGKFGKIVEAIEPYQVFIENVAGLARVKGYSTYHRFKNMLAKRGYQYSEGVLDAKKYGVPQTRRRLVLIATKEITPSLPPVTHGLGLLPYVTVRDAIEEYSPLKAGEQDQYIPNHKTSSVSPLNLQRLQSTPHDGGSRIDWPEELWLDCHKNKHHGHTDVYGRMQWDKPAPTLTCRCYSISNGRYGHPEQDRALSIREAAKLQSFNDDFIFFANSFRDYGAQVGNAVPVKLAEVIGNHILRIAQQRNQS